MRIITKARVLSSTEHITQFCEKNDRMAAEEAKKKRKEKRKRKNKEK